MEGDSEALEGQDLSELGRCWELEGFGSVNLTNSGQIVDVQGRLRQAYTFWKDTLQAPNNFVLDSNWLQIVNVCAYSV